ncbi:MAG: amidase [Planctomycetaceae bacterium]|nr:amidase [Planctomycetaceae bacterium]
MSNKRSSNEPVAASCSRRSFLKISAVTAAAPSVLQSTAGHAGDVHPTPTSTDLVFESATTLASMIRQKKVSPAEVVEQQLARIRQIEPKIQAIEHLADTEAQALARKAKEAIDAGDVDWDKQPLFGVPISLKDNIEVRNMPTKCGAPSLKDYFPEEDATVVRRLKAAGAIIFAKTRMPFLATQYESANLFGRANNPYDLSRTVGGSSGGEAALIAAGGSPLGIGQDGNGSIRVPSHWCGTVGLAPSIGRVSIAGIHPPSENSMPHWMLRMGPMARRVEDLALCLSVIAGLDYQDPFTNAFPIGDYRDVNLPDLTIAYWTHQKGYEHARPTDETIEAIESAARALEKRGAKVKRTQPPVDIESMFQSTMAMYFHDGEEGWSKLLREYKAEGDALLQESTRATMDWFHSHTTDEIEGFMDEWPTLRRKVFASMEGFAAVLAPVCETPAMSHGTVMRNAVERRSMMHVAIYSPIYAFPFGSVRCSESPEGLPIGVQVVGSAHREDIVLRVMAELEDEFGGWRASLL